MPVAIIAVLLAAQAPCAAAPCYTLFDAKNTIAFQSASPPVDLSKPISAEIERAFPGLFLVMSNVGACLEIDCDARPPVLAGSSPESSSPALALAPELHSIESYALSGVRTEVTGRHHGHGRRPGVDVTVRGHYLADGSYVHRHRRAAPGRWERR